MSSTEIAEVDEEQEALDQLEAIEEIPPIEITEEEIFEEGEEAPSELEELFPEEPYTVYYQEA